MTTKDFDKYSKRLIELNIDISKDIKFLEKNKKLKPEVRIDWLKKTNVRIKNLISSLTILKEHYRENRL